MKKVILQYSIAVLNTRHDETICKFWNNSCHKFDILFQSYDIWFLKFEILSYTKIFGRIHELVKIRRQRLSSHPLLNNQISAVKAHRKRNNNRHSPTNPKCTLIGMNKQHSKKIKREKVERKPYFVSLSWCLCSIFLFSRWQIENVIVSHVQRLYQRQIFFGNWV